MEGLLPRQRRADEARWSSPIWLESLEETTALQRWLAFLFLIAMAGLIVMCLVTAALP